MTLEEIRRKVKSKYRLGQTVKLRINDNDHRGGKIISVIILKFDVNTILTERNGFKESYRYFDFLQKASKIKAEAVKKVKTGLHHSKAIS